jgi:hypothetical protein
MAEIFYFRSGAVTHGFLLAAKLTSEELPHSSGLSVTVRHTKRLRLSLRESIGLATSNLLKHSMTVELAMYWHSNAAEENTKHTSGITQKMRRWHASCFV